jgi:hypothetical protein
MGFLKNNPVQSSRAYPILSDVSGFPGSKIGDTFDSCNIGHGPLKRCGSSGVPLWLWIGAPFGFRQGWAGLTSLARIWGAEKLIVVTPPDAVQPALPRQNVLGQTLQVTGGARKKATGCMAVPRFRRSSRQYYGQYTREALAELKLLRNVFRQSRKLLQRM